MYYFLWPVQLLHTLYHRSRHIHESAVSLAGCEQKERGCATRWLTVSSGREGRVTQCLAVSDGRRVVLSQWVVWAAEERGELWQFPQKHQKSERRAGADLQWEKVWEGTCTAASGSWVSASTWRGGGELVHEGEIKGYNFTCIFWISKELHTMSCVYCNVLSVHVRYLDVCCTFRQLCSGRMAN